MRTSGNVLLTAVIAGCGCHLIAACMYTVSLLLDMPPGITLPLIGIAWTAWIRYGIPRLPGRPPAPDVRLLLVAAVTTLAACAIIKPHGAYDAWLHWNSLAKYMSSAAGFRMLHEPGSLWHADYPPGLPAPTGLLWRLSGTDRETVPRIISFLFYLCIPLLLCDAALKQNRVPHLWIAVLALFTVNFESLSQGLNQYADVPLALFLLLSLMYRDVQAPAATRPLFTQGLLLGGCLLMKNEGVVIVAAFLLAHIMSGVSLRGAWRLLGGLAGPLAVLIAYKHYIPTQNDLVSGMNGNAWRNAVDPERYRIIGYYLLRFGIGRFPLFILFFGWIAWLHRRRRWRPDAGMLCLLICAAGYLLVYLTTDIGLAWLVPTSMNRLMMQLLPAGVYLAIRSLESAAPARI